MLKIRIGAWVERESRTISRNPTSYAADWDTIQTRPGTYDVYLLIHCDPGVFTCPMPQWACVGIDADRIDGAYANAFGGAIRSWTPAERGPTRENVQLRAYQIGDCESLSIDPEFAFLAGENQIAECKARGFDWFRARSIASVQ